MDLPEYIQKVGDAEFARRFGIKERTALAYRCRQRRPRPDLAVKIIAETPVTWAGIYGVVEKGA
jgi:hypothetical protein